MGVQVIYVLTHDSIGLGEDGPTHQPVEHLAALRAMPNVQVYRPADGVETAECWELAILNRGGPSILILTRQDLAPVRQAGEENRCQSGGYVVKRRPLEDVKSPSSRAGRKSGSSIEPSEMFRGRRRSVRGGFIAVLGTL